MKSRGRTKEGARAGEIGRLYFPQGRAPPCSSSIERGKGNRRDWGREDDCGSTWNAPRPIQPLSPLLLRRFAAPATAPRPPDLRSVSWCLRHPTSRPCPWIRASDGRTYAPSRTACFRFYMGSPSSACFPTSRPGPAPSVLHVGSSFLCFSYYVLPLFKSLDYIASLLMLWILDLDMDILQSPVMCYAACD